jgi:SpoIID/LytB domain protein
VGSRRGWVVAIAIAASLIAFAIRASTQSDVTDADLDRVNNGRTIAIGALTGDRAITRLSLETYVARVLAGEAEQNAPDAELEALAIAIRTYATFNAGRHGRDGFDLCDTTHCQVMRTATAATRRAALTTAGQVLTWRGAAAEIFYSANCGGRSESAAAVWPGADLPYLKVVKDDVHDDDVPWRYEVALHDLQTLLAQKGFAGDRLKDVRVVSHTDSGRVASLRLIGLEPDIIAGDQFRLLAGPRDLKSTAFSVEKHGDRLEFTGRGYGHGVGMCVVGAGRRARRGESVRDILSQYYPGLVLTSLDSLPPRFRTDPSTTAVPAETRVGRPDPVAAAPTLPVRPPAAGAPASSIAAPGGTPGAVVAAGSISPVTIRGAGSAASELQQAAVRAQSAMARALGVSASPIVIELHDTVESFRQATGKPWWVSASVTGQTVDLAPTTLLAQRDGIELTLRNAVAQAMVAHEFTGRPEWMRVGAGRYFSRLTPVSVPDHKGKLKCPADAELTLAISATAQREAESRAEACFARALAAAGDWRSVRER